MKYIFQIFILCGSMVGGPAAKAVELGRFSDVDQSFQYGKWNKGLEELDQATGKKWAQLEEWQKKESWINEQVRLGLIGTVYESGMFGGTVSRNVVPDKNNGWLVVDKLQIQAGPLLQIGNLAGNLFFQEYMPYVQVGVNYGRTYVNVRQKATYRDALLANPFQFKNIPVAAPGFSRFETGEIVSTVTVGGVYVRVGASIFDLMGISVVGGTTLGPAAKVHVNKQFKITMSKNSPTEVLVMVEDGVETGLGVGISGGISIDDLLDIPVSIGINQEGGYTPLRINYKMTREKIRSVIYRINIATAEGVRAYEKLVNRDLTLVDDLAKKKNGTVTREMLKEGVKDSAEFNAGLDLIFYRSGFRNIFVEAKYNTLYQDGKRFTYKEISSEKIFERQSFAGAWQTSEKYTALVPTSRDQRILNSFVIDSLFVYSNSDTSGEDLEKMLERLKLTVNQLPVTSKPDEEKDYGQVSMNLSVRFPAAGIQKILRVSDSELWMALATSSGLANPTQWTSERGRNAYSEQNDDNGSLLEAASAVRENLYELRKIADLAQKAKKLVRLLKEDSATKLLHRTMIEIVGRDQLYIRGKVQGVSRPRGKLVPKTHDED